jgi:Tol biopolymer transport system component
VNSGKQQTITHRTKYFTPDISNDGSKVVAVNYKADGKCELHVLDAVTGGLLKNIESSEINVFTDPKFINDSSYSCLCKVS